MRNLTDLEVYVIAAAEVYGWREVVLALAALFMQLSPEATAPTVSEFCEVLHNQRGDSCDAQMDEEIEKLKR